VAIGLNAAEKIKMQIGSAHESVNPGSLSIIGKDMVHGIPKTLTVTSEDVREAIEEPVAAIVDAVRRALEKLPPELVSDLQDSGVTLTGGGALLKGLDRRIAEKTSLKVTVTDDPLTCVVMGSGKALEQMDRYRKVFIG
jgi:rod shape-determining protein MreB